MTLYLHGMTADGEPADGMREPSQLHRWADRFIDGIIAAIFLGGAAPQLGVAFDPHHQLNLWNHCEPPISLNSPQVAYRTARRIPDPGSIVAGYGAKW